MTVDTWATTVKERDGWRCVECGSVDQVEAHHIQPRALGGKNDIDNGVSLCNRCHMRRHRGPMSGRGLGVQTGRIIPKMRRAVGCVMLDAAVLEAVRKYATEDDRPITVSNAIDLLLKEALTARGLLVAPPPISADMGAPPAGKPAAKRKR